MLNNLVKEKYNEHCIFIAPHSKQLFNNLIFNTPVYSLSPALLSLYSWLFSRTLKQPKSLFFCFFLTFPCVLFSFLAAYHMEIYFVNFVLTMEMKKQWYFYDFQFSWVKTPGGLTQVFATPGTHQSLRILLHLVSDLWGELGWKETSAYIFNGHLPLFSEGTSLFRK